MLPVGTGRREASGSPLIEAIHRADVKFVRDHLNQHPESVRNRTAHKSLTPLHAVAVNCESLGVQQSEEIVSLLLEAHADVNAVTSDNESVSLLAFQAVQGASNPSGPWKVLRTVLEHPGMDVDMPSGADDISLLCHAIWDCEVEVAQFLVEHAGADVHLPDHMGYSPLHICVLARREDSQKGAAMLEFLLRERADVNQPSGPEQSSLLVYAARECDAFAVEQLLLHGATVDDASLHDPLHGTILHHMANRHWGDRLQEQRSAILLSLLRAGGNINTTRVQDGFTVLHEVMQSAPGAVPLDFLRVLIEAKVDVNVQDKQGNNAFESMHLHAKSKQAAELVTTLWSSGGVNLDQPVGTLAKTPLLVLAADATNVGLTRRLLELGADVFALSHDGSVALKVAVQRLAVSCCSSSVRDALRRGQRQVELETIVQLLLEREDARLTAGASVPDSYTGGCTPLSVALKSKWMNLLYPHVLEHLVVRCTDINMGYSRDRPWRYLEQHVSSGLLGRRRYNAHTNRLIELLLHRGVDIVWEFLPRVCLPCEYVPIYSRSRLGVYSMHFKKLHALLDRVLHDALPKDLVGVVFEYSSLPLQIQ